MHIDWWTLTLQTVNVLILIWMLGRFLFRPVADLVARRREATAKLLDEAATARQAADDVRAEGARLRAELGAERQQLIEAARKAAEFERQAALVRLSGEIEQRRKELTSAFEHERAALERAVLDRASELSIDIARRLLARLPPGATMSAFLDGLGRALGELPATVRDSLTAAEAGHPLEMVTAAPLGEAEIAKVRGLLRTALGAEVPLQLCHDPGLIAGFEIRGRNVIVRNNWQADLAEIRKELDR